MNKPEQLLKILDKKKCICIIVHNNPDPDALASAVGIAFLLERKGYRNVRVYYSGLIGRAENRELVKILPVKLHKTNMIRKVKDRQFILVDSQPYSGNIYLPDGAEILGSIDHHVFRKATKSLPFYDVRPQYGACATIVCEYLQSEEIEPLRALATSLAYAIYSETQGLGREATEEDRGIYVKLMSNVNFSRLSKILNPSLSRMFISNLSRVLLNTFYYKNIAGVILEELPYPDFAAEMADFLLRIQNVSWALVMGSYENQLSVSLRTSRLKGHAYRAVKKIIPSSGTSGGHEMIAGAQVPLGNLSSQAVRSLERDILRNMLDYLNHTNVKSLGRLVSDEPFSLF
jgi:nanoRNase/pAp phosphatase (c-di-AMP/oligoRNAs hydrolase)